MAETAGKPIICKAAIAIDKNLSPAYSIETVEVETPSTGHVRVKIAACGVCHTDLSAQRGIISTNFPRILGHEASGIIESVGEGVTRFIPGDHVIFLFVPYCGTCVACCTHPRTNVGCKNTTSNIRDIGIKWNGRPLLSDGLFSCFTEYTVASANRVTKINKDAPLDKACLFACSLPTGYGSVINVAEVTSGSTCAVWGIGAIGLATIFGCKKAGAKKIIAIDINPEKKEIAKRLGATDFINPKDHSDSIENLIIKMTDGGCDYTFECAGIVATAEAALKASNPGWGVCTFIGIAGFDQNISMKPWDLFPGRKINSCLIGGYKGNEISDLVELYVNGEFPVEEFISYTLPLEKINEAFQLLISGKSIRTVLLM